MARASVARGDTRLDAKAWVFAALALLAEQGVDGVRVEPLAKRLNVTKGSFYWHFKDRDALLEVMLSEWRKKATITIIERLDSERSSPADRLRRLLRLPHASGASEVAAAIELSIRLWGRRDERARRTLEEVDRLRLVYIANLMRDCGVRDELAHARAVIAYSYIRVATTLIPAEDEQLRQLCESFLISN